LFSKCIRMNGFKPKIKIEKKYFNFFPEKKIN
jgi:hypothetical protein